MSKEPSSFMGIGIVSVIFLIISEFNVVYSFGQVEKVALASSKKPPVILIFLKVQCHLVEPVFNSGTEQLKAEQPMLWVRKMNGIRTAAEEMVLTEIVYG